MSSRKPEGRPKRFSNRRYKIVATVVGEVAKVFALNEKRVDKANAAIRVPVTPSVLKDLQRRKSALEIVRCQQTLRLPVLMTQPRTRTFHCEGDSALGTKGGA
jgi:hypothetical protein